MNFIKTIASALGIVFISSLLYGYFFGDAGAAHLQYKEPKPVSFLKIDSKVLDQIGVEDAYAGPKIIDPTTVGNKKSFFEDPLGTVLPSPSPTQQ